MDIERLAAMLRAEEGVRGRPYRDSRGILTIGVGHNLEAAPLGARAIAAQLEDDIAATVAALRAALPWFDGLDGPRQTVLADMAFNLGVPKLLGFKHMLAAAAASDWRIVASEMLNSTWHEQVGVRAERLAHAMLTGELP